MNIVESTVVERRVGRMSEHGFFLALSLLIVLVVFIGFAKTYYLAPLFSAKPLPAAIVHLHGAVFTCWIALLAVQTSLVHAGHTRAHRRLGLLGLGLAPLVVILGVLVSGEMLTRTTGLPGFDSPVIFAVALSEICGFAIPVFFAFWFRRTPAVHKRLILIGTIALTTAGFGRWPIHLLLHQPLPAMLAAFTLLALLAVYDLLSRGSVHRATAWGGAWIVGIELGGFVVGHTTAWRAFSAHVLSLTR